SSAQHVHLVSGGRAARGGNSRFGSRSRQSKNPIRTHRRGHGAGRCGSSDCRSRRRKFRDRFVFARFRREIAMVDRPWSVKEKNDPFVVPSFETISFSLPSMQSWEALLKGETDGWVYMSDGNPTLAALEKLLAHIQGVDSCWVTSTGKSAIAATLLALLKAGDHIIILREGYKSTRLFVEGTLTRFGVSVTMLGVDDLKQLTNHIQPGVTRLIVLEAPTNPMTRVPDLVHCTTIAKEHGITTVLDNSLAGFHQHGDVPVDVIVHSLSKFASGVGDVMGGAVLGSRETVSRIKSTNVW